MKKLSLYGLLCPLLAGVIFNPANNSWAGDYTFTRIADTSGLFDVLNGSPTVFDSLGSPPTINDAGTVAFRGVTDAGDEEIFTGDGRTLTLIASAHTPSGFNRNPVINNSGTIAFGGVIDGVFGIFTSKNGTLTTIADNSSFFTPAFQSPPSINNKGTVAFGAAHEEGGITERGIFINSGASSEAIADTSGIFSGLNFPVINNKGMVAFWASLDDGGTGIFLHKKGAITTVADTDDGFLGFYLVVSLNSKGNVAFRASDGGGQILFKSDGSFLSVVADSTGAFSGFNESAINLKGTVVFQGFLDTGGSGIFTGADSVADKVIATGDPFFGSVMLGPSIWAGAINRRGQIAFRAVLADGTEGIYRANPVP